MGNLSMLLRATVHINFLTAHSVIKRLIPEQNKIHQPI